MAEKKFTAPAWNERSAGVTRSDSTRSLFESRNETSTLVARKLTPVSLTTSPAYVSWLAMFVKRVSWNVHVPANAATPAITIAMAGMNLVPRPRGSRMNDRMRALSVGERRTGDSTFCIGLSFLRWFDVVALRSRQGRKPEVSCPAVRSDPQIGFRD